jgi:hypothetical protein
MPTYGVTSAAIGQTLEQNGVLIGIKCDTPPPGGILPVDFIRRYFCLVDDGMGWLVPKAIINVDAYVHAISGGTKLLGGQTQIAFRN